MPLFDKQAGRCLRISTQVVKWPERGDVPRVTDTAAWMEYVPWSRDHPRPSSAISQESGLVRFVMDSVNRNCPKYLWVVKWFVFQDFLGKWFHVDLGQHIATWTLIHGSQTYDRTEIIAATILPCKCINKQDVLLRWIPGFRQ